MKVRHLKRWKPKVSSSSFECSKFAYLNTKQLNFYNARVSYNSFGDFCDWLLRHLPHIVRMNPQHHLSSVSHPYVEELKTTDDYWLMMPTWAFFFKSKLDAAKFKLTIPVDQLIPD